MTDEHPSGKTPVGHIQSFQDFLMEPTPEFFPKPATESTPPWHIHPEYGVEE